MKRNIYVFLILLLMVTISVQGQITGIVKIEKVARLTGTKGSDSMNPTWEVGIGGADLGYMINHKERTYFVFGDSFSSELAYGEKPDTSQDWRWNTMAYTTDNDPRDGIKFDGWIVDKDGKAREIIKDTRMNPITNIPTGGISIGDKIILWYMAMSFWGDDKDHCWKSYFAGLAWSDDDGENFHIQEDFQFPGDSNFGMVSATYSNADPKLKDDPYIYIWGTPSNRCGGVKLARVLSREITNLKSYEYFGGIKDDKPIWIKSEYEAPLIVEPEVGEMSVMYNHWAGMWIMMHCKFNPNDKKLTAGDIVLRQSVKPWGPWSKPITVVPYNLSGYPYGSYMNPKYVENEGETVYFTMSLWDPYDVFWMKVKFKNSSSK